MRRKSSAAEDQLDPRELIDRVTAEHSSPSVPSPRAGRSASAAVPATALLGGVSASGRHRLRADDEPDRLPEPSPSRTSATTIAELHEPHPSGPLPVYGPAGGRGDGGDLRDPAEDRSLVEVDREVSARRSRARRFAPIGIGLAAVLAAAMVMTLLQPGAEEPQLQAALVGDSSRRAVSGTPVSAYPAVGRSAGGALGDATEGAADQIGSAVAAQKAAEERAERRRQAAEESAADDETSPAPSEDGGSQSGSEGRRSAPAPAAGPVGGAVQVAGQGVQAALAKGWSAIGGDEFAGGGLGKDWTAYDGEGHDGQGRRTPDAVSVENGNLVIRGDSEGNTGGIAWGTPRKYGKWEMRARFPAGDKQYHPVLLLWPSEVGWPEGGEIDFAETTSASKDVSFFLHYGSSNSQKDAKQNLDITQWHNYAVEWTPDAIVGYIDGKEWFRSTDPETQPPGPMHATIQLDYFPDGGSPTPSEMQVAWMRQYS